MESLENELTAGVLALLLFKTLDVQLEEHNGHKLTNK